MSKDPQPGFPEDAAWARALAGGDEAAWRRFETEARPVVAGALRRAGVAESETAWQELCLRLNGQGGRRLRDFQGLCRLTTWASVLAIRIARRAARAEGSRAAAERAASPRPPSEPLLAAADREALERALGRLEPEDRFLLRLLYWDSLTQAEVGRVLGIGEDTVSVRARDLLRCLRNLLDEKG